MKGDVSKAEKIVLAVCAAYIIGRYMVSLIFNI